MLKIVFIVICCFAVLIILGSVIFSVRKIEVYCENFDCDEVVNGVSLREEVLGLVEDSIRGKSIFLLDDEKIHKKVNALGYVYVINVERKFPNLVYIDLFRRIEYMQIKLDEGYALLDRDCYVSRIVPDRISPEEIIDVTLSGPVNGNGVLGEKINLSNNDSAVLTEILTTFERLDNYSNPRVIKHIDLSKKTDTIYLETRMGVIIKIMGTSSIQSKLQLAVSLYINELETKSSGQITVYNDNDGNPTASWNENTDYYN